MEALGPSSVEFIEKASGIKTRYLIDKKNCLDINVMKPVMKQETPGKNFNTCRNEYSCC